MEKTISDELLTRWLCGKATPEEENKVLDYLADSDENIEDLKAIVAATQLANNEAVSMPRRRNLFKIPIAIAASIALLVCVSIPLWFTKQPQTPISTAEHSLQIEEAPIYATCDTINDEN